MTDLCRVSSSIEQSGEGQEMGCTLCMLLSQAMEGKEAAGLTDQLGHVCRDQAACCCQHNTLRNAPVSCMRRNHSICFPKLCFFPLPCFQKHQTSPQNCTHIK